MKSLLRTVTLTACAAATLSAATIGGGTLFTQSYANEVEGWLGRTNLAFTDIFSQGANDTTATFHTAVDKQGETVTLIQTSLGLVGGYDPVSWDATLNAYIQDPANTGRTAFIFNLSTSMIERQRLDNANGQFQTYNSNRYGPCFGGGVDLCISTMTGGGAAGTAIHSSYQNGSSNLNIFGNGPQGFSSSKIETFTISQAAGTLAPEPTTWTIMFAPFAAILFLRRSRKV